MNYLYWGDNLPILHRLAPASIDLCYIDPPFRSQRNYHLRFNHGEAVFRDTWHWSGASEADLEVISKELPRATGQLVEGLMAALGRVSLLAYLVRMTVVMAALHRLLKGHGSFYLHCSPLCSHYLKIIADSIFCPLGGSFQNELIWSYRTGGASKRRFARKHDVILFYTKSDHWTFHPTKYRSYMMHHYGFRKSQFQRDPHTGQQYSWVYPRDVWEIPAVGSDSKERLGYPTQKPEALLTRIIQASTNPGDTVLDAYCGCGTTLVVAQRHHCRWIGIDVARQAIDLTLQRLTVNCPKEADSQDLLHQFQIRLIEEMG